MRINIRNALVAILLAGAIVGGGCVKQPPSAWEYHVEYNVSVIAIENTKTRIDALGSQGWELVLVADGAWVFKRPKK